MDLKDPGALYHCKLPIAAELKMIAKWCVYQEIMDRMKVPATLESDRLDRSHPPSKCTRKISRDFATPIM